MKMELLYYCKYKNGDWLLTVEESSSRLFGIIEDKEIKRYIGSGTVWYFLTEDNEVYRTGTERESILLNLWKQAQLMEQGIIEKNEKFQKFLDRDKSLEG